MVIAANFLFSKLGKDVDKNETEKIEVVLEEETPEEIEEPIEEETQEEVTEENKEIETKEETNVLTSEEVVIEGAPKKNKRLVYKKRDAQN